MATYERRNDRATRDGKRLIADLAREFRIARVNVGLSQAEVGRALGVSRERISRFERGADTDPGLSRRLATNAVADSPAAVQEIIDTARKLIADQKWAEVAQTLSKLQGANLTPEQEKSLLDLKDQLEKMIRDAVGK